jgi:hypothetical protein
VLTAAELLTQLIRKALKIFKDFKDFTKEAQRLHAG